MTNFKTGLSEHHIDQIHLTYFIHDSVPEQTKDLIRNGAMNWLSDNLFEVLRVRVSTRLIFNEPPYTDFNYTITANHEVEKKIEQWGDFVDAYITENDIPAAIERKYILLTPNRLNKNILGVATHGGSAAIATLERKKAVAHEVGHLLTADHHHAAIIQTANGLQHTNLTSSLDGTDSYTFSKASQLKMRAYLGLL